MKLIDKKRCIITESDQEGTGTIVIPSNIGKEYQLGKVVHVPASDNNLVEEGQYVFFQLPPMVKNSTGYAHKADIYNGKGFFILHQEDVIATLSEPNVSLATFKINGNWLLLDMVIEGYSNSSIALPDTYRPPIDEFFFKVKQIGGNVDENKEGLPYAIDDTVYIEKNRCNPIILEGKEYVFLHKQYVYAVDR